jgi:hypothetical protein
MVRPGKANRSATLKNYRVILAKLQLPDGAGLRARLGNAARGGALTAPRRVVTIKSEFPL